MKETTGWKISKTQTMVGMQKSQRLTSGSAILYYPYFVKVNSTRIQKMIYHDFVGKILYAGH